MKKALLFIVLIFLSIKINCNESLLVASSASSGNVNMQSALRERALKLQRQIDERQSLTLIEEIQKADGDEAANKRAQELKATQIMLIKNISAAINQAQGFKELIQCWVYINNLENLDDENFDTLTTQLKDKIFELGISIQDKDKITALIKTINNKRAERNLEKFVFEIVAETPEEQAARLKFEEISNLQEMIKNKTLDGSDLKIAQQRLNTLVVPTILSQAQGNNAVSSNSAVVRIPANNLISASVARNQRAAANLPANKQLISSELKRTMLSVMFFLIFHSKYLKMNPKLILMGKILSFCSASYYWAKWLQKK